ncbi:hypothetical protein LP669_25770, partial [Escherichia coli]|nr:hypothetical protein [Escherichia coli]
IRSQLVCSRHPLTACLLPASAHSLSAPGIRSQLVCERMPGADKPVRARQGVSGRSPEPVT